MTNRMTRFSKTILLLGTAILALNACSTKGPGEIGSKDDIVVKNNGLPGAQTQQAAVKAEGEDFSSTVEQAEAIPTPEVAAGEPLPDTTPAVEAAVAQHEAAKAPIAPDTASPADAASAPVSETRPLDAMAPTTPVTQPVTPPPANAPVTATSPAAPAPTPATAPAAVTTPAAPASAAADPLDPTAPYSPKAVAAANAAAGVATPVVPAAPTTTTTMTTTAPAAVPSGGVNFSDPAIIRSAQAALKQKGLYKGAETGIVDTEFLNALTIYQTGNQLPVGGINEPTLRYLGVIE